MALASANFHTGWGYGGMCPQFNLAFSLEEAPTFSRCSSLIGKSLLLGHFSWNCALKAESL
jgi:hypothetical protein